MTLNPTNLSLLEYQYFYTTIQKLWLKCLKSFYVVCLYKIIIFSSLKIFKVISKKKFSLII